MSHPSRGPLRVPLGTVEPQFDIDAPRYRGSNPATYLLLALCYETLAGPSVRPAGSALGADSVAPDYSRMIPRIAEGFGEGSDGSWSLRLRPGVRSQSGNELGAHDVKWAFERATALDTFAAYRWGQIAGVADSDDGVQVIDNYTVRFRLRAPNPNFASYFFFATPMIMDSVEVRSHATGSDPWALAWSSKPHVAGFGPYDLDELTADRMTFRARNDGWPGAPPNAEVVVQRVGSRAEALTELGSSGPVYLAGLRPDEAIALRTRSSVFLNGSWGGHSYIGMNYNRPPFDDIRVRQALSYATPYDEIIDRGFLGLARRWHGPVPSFDAWSAGGSGDQRADRGKATALLKEAGYGAGFETALYVSTRPDLLRIADILKEAYHAIGVDLELRDMSALPAGWCPPLYLRTECGHNINETVYDLAHDHVPINPVIPAPGGWGGTDTWFARYPGSRMLEDRYRAVLVAPTAVEREARCRELQRAIVDFAPAVFLAENLQINASNEPAQGWARDHQNRLVQALQFQNCNTSYLPS